MGEIWEVSDSTPTKACSVTSKGWCIENSIPHKRITKNILTLVNMNPEWLREKWSNKMFDRSDCYHYFRTLRKGIEKIKPILPKFAYEIHIVLISLNRKAKLKSMFQTVACTLSWKKNVIWDRMVSVTDVQFSSPDRNATFKANVASTFVQSK